MSKARGKVEKVDLLQIAGLDSRVWQKDGSSTDNSGVVFTLRGEVAKVAGIQPLVDWNLENQYDASYTTDDPSPFWDPFTGKPYPLMSIGSFQRAGAVEILIEYGGNIGVVSGDKVRLLATGRQVATRPSEGTQFLQVGGAVIILNGVDENLKWDGRNITPLGIPFPPSAPRVATWGDGNSKVPFSIQTEHAYPGTGIVKTAADITNTYRYKLTYLNNQGTESEGSGPSNKMSDRNVASAVGSADTTFWIMVTDLEQYPDRADIVSRRLYRAGADDQAFFLLAEIQGLGSINYIDDSSIAYPLSTEGAIRLPPDGYNSPPPLAKMAMFLRGITFYAGDPESPRTLYYSLGYGLKETVPRPGNSVQIATEDGSDYITAMCVSADYGLVFTTRSVHMVSLDKDGTPVVTPMSQNVGAVGDRAVTNFEGKTYFFSSTGVFMFDGTTPRPLSSELNQQVENLPKAFLKDVVAFPDPEGRRVWFSVCSGNGSENNEVWAIHVDTGAVSKMNASVFDAIRYKDETLVAFARDAHGPVLPEDERDHPEQGSFRLTDIGMWGCLRSIAEVSSIVGFFDTKWIVGKNPESDKTFYRVDVFYCQSGAYDLDLTWFTDWENEPTGTTTVHMHDPTATTWGTHIPGEFDANAPGAGAPTLSELRLWDDTGYPAGFTPTDPGRWDSQRVRSVRVDLGTALPTREPSIEDHGEGLTAKSIKFRFGSSVQEVPIGSFIGRMDPENEDWKIVGIVLFYSDHGVRAEGTDLQMLHPFGDSSGLP